MYSDLSRRQELVNKIRISDVILQDERGFHLDELTWSNITVFTTETAASRPYEFPDQVHLALAYEMNLNKFKIERTVYTTLDWLGDVGGLMGILFDMGGFLLMFITGSGLNYMLL